MTRTRTTLSLVAAISLLGVSSAAFAEDRVVHVKVRADSGYLRMEAAKAVDGNPGAAELTITPPAAARRPACGLGSSSARTPRATLAVLGKRRAYWLLPG